MGRNNIVLVGFMGTGKTVVGEKLASELGFKYIDTDTLIESEAGRSIPDIFQHEGEKKFREYESEAISIITHLKNYVISTGGGAVMNEQNINNMKKAGLVACLEARPEVIYERTRHDDNRPLLQTPDPRKKIRMLLKIRDSQYKKADCAIDTSDLTVDQVVGKILSEWEKEK